MNPDHITVQPSDVCTHLADDNLIYRDILSRLQHGVSVQSISENVNILLHLMGPVETAGPRIGRSLTNEELVDIVNKTGKGFFIDLGVCEDANISKFGIFNGAIVGEPSTPSFETPLHLDNSMVNKTVQLIGTQARKQEWPSLVIVTACKLRRNPDNALLCDEMGNWFSYDADPEVIQMGAIPGQYRHTISSLGVGSNSPERTTELRNIIKHDLRMLITALDVALKPPALFPDDIPWRSLYTMGLGLMHFTRIAKHLRAGKDNIQIMDGHRAIGALAREDSRCADGIQDPLGLFTQFLFLCKSINSTAQPQEWSKKTSLQWAAFLLRSEVPESSFRLWKLVVCCEHMAEVSIGTEKLAKLAMNSRQMDDLVGLSVDSDTKIPDVIASTDSEGVKLAKSAAEGYQIKIRGKTFSPEEVGPTSPDSFDHLGPSFFGAQKLARKTRTNDGIRVGKGRAIDPAAFHDKFSVRRGFRRTELTVEQGVLLMSQNTLISDFKRAVGKVNAIEVSAFDISVAAEFSHVDSEQQLVRTDAWRVASRTAVNAILNGQLGTDAAIWLFYKLRNGDVRVNKKSKEHSFLVGSHSTFTDNGVLVFKFVDPGVTKRVPTYMAAGRLWVDLDNCGDLRRVCKVTEAIICVEEDTYSGNQSELRECSVIGEYGFGAKKIVA